MRIALMLEYDGSQYHGWQTQTGLHTLQQALEQAVSQVADESISVVCAGRTDTGVHAVSQVVHFDTEKSRTIRAWVQGANTYLPKDMCVKWGKETSEEFHARYSALSRRYCYVIHNTTVRPALLRSNVTWQYRSLDDKAMHEAAQCLLGEQDFTSFRSVECQSKTPMRRILYINVKRYHDYVFIDVCANAFLHHMVRNIVGVLVAVGSGRESKEWVKEVLAAKDRKLGAQTAPASGLYLSEVHYPKELAVPKTVGGSSFLLYHLN